MTVTYFLFAKLFLQNLIKSIVILKTFEMCNIFCINKIEANLWYHDFTHNCKFYQFIQR